jgi:hypothetical protein
VIPRPCASWAKDEGGCRRRELRCRAAAAVWSLQTIVRILIYVVLFRCPPAVLRDLGVRDGVLAGPTPAAEVVNVWSGHHVQSSTVPRALSLR